ncbi:ABC transporter permease [bacterium]|nr:ABC transporter permease [bacterium]MBU4510626.1 ABC transporter permease [bacterium]
MYSYILKRFVSLILVLLGVSILIFFMVRLVPGSALELYLGTQVETTPEQMEELKIIFGEDKPVLVLYGEWLFRILRGDFGCSLRTSRPVLSDIISRLPLTLELTIFALCFSVLIGVPLGILSSIKQNPLMGLVIRITGLLGLSIPQFFLAILFVLFFSSFKGWIPMGAYIPLLENPILSLKMLFFPSLALGGGLAAVIMRFTRNSILEVFQMDYIRTARSKGVSEKIILIKHALKNALLPVITVLGFNAGYLMGGAVVIEEVFALPGMGRLVLYAIYQRDYPLLQGIVLITAAFFVLINLFTDILYIYIDPRIRYG